MNAAIGIAREHCAASNNGLDEMLRYKIYGASLCLHNGPLHLTNIHSHFHYCSEISSRLFDLGAAVATPVATSSTKKKAYTEVVLLVVITTICFKSIVYI